MLDKLTGSATFRSHWDWSEPHNIGINFPVIRLFSSSVQNAYSNEELNGSCVIKIQFSFSFRVTLVRALNTEAVKGKIGRRSRLVIS